MRLKELMQSHEMREKLGRDAREDMKKFSSDIVIKQWDEFLTKIVNEYGK